MGAQRPYPPRDVLAQPSAGSLLLTWKRAEDSEGQDRFRVYYPDDLTVFADISDRAALQCVIPASSAATANVFVSALSTYGMESQKVQAQGTASTWTGQPAVATPPPGFSDEQPAAGDKAYRRRDSL